MNARTPRRLAALTSILLLLAACSATGGVSPSASSSAAEASPDPSHSEDAMASVAAIPEKPEGIPASLWTAVLSDLEERLGGPVSEPEVVSAAAMTWNDGSLGCPE